MPPLFNQTQRHQLTQHLHQEIDATEEMLQALQVEADALSQHRADRLDQAVQIKQEKTLLLAQAGQKREQLMKQLHGDEKEKQTDVQATTAEKNPFKQDKVLRVLWHKLLTLAEQCQQQNRINGALVESCYQQSRYALGILQGLTAETGQHTEPDSRQSEGYNHFGQTTYLKHSRTIAQV